MDNDFLWYRSLSLRRADPEVYEHIMAEEDRLRNELEMIASETLPSIASREALSSLLTVKYAEGKDGDRYYWGSEDAIDPLERLAKYRAKNVFGAEHANVQPLSGSPANLAFYLAFMEPGDTFMAMGLKEGGHLTHGHPVSATGKWFRRVPYTVNEETYMLDEEAFDEIRKIARKERPKMIISGYTAYLRVIDFEAFWDIANEVGAYHVSDMAHTAGLVAAGIHPSPVPYSHAVSLTTHKTLGGARGAIILCKDEVAERVDRAIFPGLQGGPHMHVIAASAVMLGEASRPEFRVYAERMVENAKCLAECLMGEYGFKLVTDGTDNHLMLLDFTKKPYGGVEAERWLGRSGIVTNKNAMPFDKMSPKTPSGIRIGTPIVTLRGMDLNEMVYVSRLIYDVLDSEGKESVILSTRDKVTELCDGFPLYPEPPEGYRGAEPTPRQLRI